MPLVMKELPDLAFLIAISCPAMDSVSQFAYLLEQQMRCEGVPATEAARVAQAYRQRERATTYGDYRKAADIVATHPMAKALAGGPIDGPESFRPADPSSEAFFNPMAILGKAQLPMLAVFGAKDTMVDPVQGAEAFRQAFKATGHPCSQVSTIPDADHVLSLARTGSFKELQEKFRTGKIVFAPEYAATLRSWLARLSPSLQQRTPAR